jgi:hypothetical protein
MGENQSGGMMAGFAVICGMMAGFGGLIVALFSLFAFNFVGAGVCLAAAGLSFGLVANATLRK